MNPEKAFAGVVEKSLGLGRHEVASSLVTDRRGFVVRLTESKTPELDPSGKQLLDVLGRTGDQKEAPYAVLKVLVRLRCVEGPVELVEVLDGKPLVGGDSAPASLPGCDTLTVPRLPSRPDLPGG
jgi:hypothetical protein